MKYTIPSPLAGSVMSISRDEGDTVQNGDEIMALESMKMLFPIIAPFNGTVTEILVQAGTIVAEDDDLFRMEDGHNG